MLEENFTSTDIKICNNLFQLPIDIEHIQSYHDSNGDKREDIWNEWGDDINSIGNLMILEQDKNRSISNNPYEVKTKVYPTSIYGIVKNQASNYSDWSIDKCRERKIIEVNKILNYLFN
ncbi:MAG: HNH endonuclease [Bacteroidetes bacterium]|nr:HNH endonuclease [Bacteroidota bacterium]